jgi:hypothetical protein
VTEPGAPPLGPADILTSLDLYGTETDRAGSGQRAVVEGAVHVGRPVPVRLPTEDLPPILRLRAAGNSLQYLWVVFPADLEPLPRGRRYASLSIGVTLTDAHTVAIGLNPAQDIIDAVVRAPGPPAGVDASGRTGGSGTSGPGDAQGSVTVTRPRDPGAPPAGWSRRPVTDDPSHNCSVTGLWTPRFGWSATPNGPGVPSILAMGALIEAPAGLATLTGEIVARAVVARSFLGLVQRSAAQSAHTAPFTVQIAAAGGPAPVDCGQVAVAARTAGSAERARADGARAVRLIVSADIERYSALGIDAARQAQADLVGVLDRAVSETGLAGRVHQQDQGDCRQLVFPAGCDEIDVLPAFYRAFRDGMCEVNQRRAQQLRVRWAADHGHAGRAAAGWDGQAPIAVARLRDSAPTRRRFGDATAADFALTVSDALYGDVVRQLTCEPLPGSFEPIEVDNPAKAFRTKGWVHIPK